MSPVANRKLLPVKTIRRPKAAVWTEPPPLVPPPRVAQRIALECRAELDAMVARLHLPSGPVELPDSGLCRRPLSTTFQGHLLEYFCVRLAGHAGSCSPESDDPPAALVETLDHLDAWGCLDAPVAS